MTEIAILKRITHALGRAPVNTGSGYLFGRPRPISPQPMSFKGLRPMAFKPRSRTIKPSFFLSEDLASLPFEARLIFAGLWTLADREGRLEDKPAQIKVYLMPYDQVDMDTILTDLSKDGLIERYQVNGQAVIRIPTFLLHQKIHPHEAQSLLPASQQDSSMSLNVITSNDKSRQGLPLQEVEVEKEVVQEIEKEISNFVEKYREICQTRGLKKVLIVNNSRRGKIRQRIKELSEVGITIEEYMRKIANSPFLRGDRGNWAGADFDFIIGAQNIGKILDGKYDRRDSDIDWGNIGGDSEEE